MNINKNPKHFIKRLTIEDWKILAALCSLADDREKSLKNNRIEEDLKNISIEFFSYYNDFENNNSRVGARVNIFQMVPTQLGDYTYIQKVISKTFEILINDYTMEYYNPSLEFKRYDSILQLFLSTKFSEEYNNYLEINKKKETSKSDLNLDKSFIQNSKNLLLKLNSDSIPHN